jgi:hypothetical protein
MGRREVGSTTAREKKVDGDNGDDDTRAVACQNTQNDPPSSQPTLTGLFKRTRCTIGALIYRFQAGGNYKRLANG